MPNRSLYRKLYHASCWSLRALDPLRDAHIVLPSRAIQGGNRAVYRLVVDRFISCTLFRKLLLPLVDAPFISTSVVKDDSPRVSLL